jgi:hypothetical protein
LSIAKPSRLIAMYYQYYLENSQTNYERLVKLAVEKEIFILKQYATRIFMKWFELKVLATRAK